MKILLLGVGMQGKAALHDLANCPAVEQVIAADRDIDRLNDYVTGRNYGSKVICKSLDVTNTEALQQMFAAKPDVMIDLLPVPLMDRVAEAAIMNNCHVVNTFYTSSKIKELALLAKEKGLAILPEFGLDPGIDLVLTGHALKSFDELTELRSYGAGIPELKAADNPLKYKVTWTFEGVLRAYRRTGIVIKNGQVKIIPDTKIFKKENTYEVDVEGLGKMEAYPNGDAEKYAQLLGIDISKLKLMGRYALRWPGHCELWEKLVDLHLLDDDPVLVDGVQVNRKRFLANAIEPHIQLGQKERDIAMVRIETTGLKNGKKVRAIHQVIDWRDLQTGLTAMSRTVGYTASIGAQMISSSKISKRGLLSPLKDVPYDLFVAELNKRNIRVTNQEQM